MMLHGIRPGEVRARDSRLLGVMLDHCVSGVMDTSACAYIYRWIWFTIDNLQNNYVELMCH